MDLDQELDFASEAYAAASDEGAGPLGFAGAAAKSGVPAATGLATLGGDGLSDGPTLPMLPSSWGAMQSS
ncbi:hypothetical protein H7H82_04240 [Mycobacterium heidelbergense]|nr:hypothetical protein [Mycobacterium heidelbergense]MCV7049821.1 hypothetical protein [Mycobacterium heidelbergense]